ncbi:cellulose synthase [Planomonospora corallina]|uniref:Cellulose synthase n=1 Tax=Planomonospora corallina TaxID=1806052 RepID=A0ABV8IDG1_9ACTN
MTYEQIPWLAVCAGLTGVGLVLSFLLLRRRGAAAGLRALAWSLLPVAAYLTGALPTLWQIGTAVTGFVTGLVLNPTVWAGVAVAGVSALLFAVSGFMRGRRLAAARAGRTEAPTAPAAPAVPARGAPAVQAGAPAAPTQPLPTRPSGQGRPAGQPEGRPPAKPAADDDFSDIEAILKRRGIG